MTVWVFHQNLTPEEERQPSTRPFVTLPLEGLPDLSLVSSPSQCRGLLQKLHPDKPPESITLMVDRIWKQFTDISQDDTVVMPLPSRKEVVIGRVSGRYQYGVDEGGGDRHMMPVEWYEKTYAMSSFGRLKDVFKQTGTSMIELQDKESRVKVLEKLPLKYNRFAKLKWIVLIFSALYIVKTVVKAIH